MIWKRTNLIVVSTLTLFVVGCTHPTPRTKDVGQPVNRALVSHYNDAAVENAIVSQATVYPYFFVKDSAELNELGAYHLDVLAEHYREHPGTLHVWADDTDSQLYAERMKVVRSTLQESGVEMAAMKIDDGLPEGRGATTDEALKAASDDKSKSGTGSMGSRPLHVSP